MRVAPNEEPVAGDERPTKRPGGFSSWLFRRHARPERKYDVALVVVHGMGNAYKSQILLEWAEPLLERIDWLTRDRAVGAGKGDDYGVLVRESDLSGDFPMVTAEVGVPTTDGRVVRRIAVLEARWSESFDPMTRREVFRWAITFLWRAIGRMLRQYSRTMVRVPLLTMRRHWRRPKTLLAAVTIDLLRFVIGAIAYGILWIVVVSLGAIGSVILPLLSPLLLIPWFKKQAQAVIDGVVESIGDVATWKERPLRASAMRVVVRDTLERAARLVGVDPVRERARRLRHGLQKMPLDDRRGRVHVLAHSQGAAVAAYTLFSDGLAPSDYYVERLTTVGAAVVLMGRDKWKGRPDVYRPVEAWRETDVAWENHWAIWDPFSAGPIADDGRSMRERWGESYTPIKRPKKERLHREERPLPVGPGEHAVHNTSNPFLDHSMYYDNTLQVVEPIARSLLPRTLPRPRPSVQYVANRLVVIDKKSLGINLLLSFVIAGCVPGLPLVSRALAETILAVTGSLKSLIALLPFPGMGTVDPTESTSFLVTYVDKLPMLSAWGWAIASALLLALLIWLNQVLAGYTHRLLVWSRCPRDTWRWLFASSFARAAYIGAATAALWLSIPMHTWPSPWDWIAPTILVASAVWVFVEPFYGPVPADVAARRTPTLFSLAGTRLARPIPSLRRAVENPEFKADFAHRYGLRLDARKEQDDEDRKRAATEGFWWSLGRTLRRRVVRPIDDWFYPKPKPRSRAGVS